MLPTKPLLAFAAFTAILATVLVLQYQANTRQQEENRLLQEQVIQGEKPPVEPAPRIEAAPPSNPAYVPDPHEELLRLRSQVAGLKQQLAEAAQTRANEHATHESADLARAADAEAFKLQFEERAHRFQNWASALFTVVSQNKGQMPASLEQLRTLLPDSDQAELVQFAQECELTYHGSVYNLTNMSDVIVARQRQAQQSPAKGTWLKAYIFADGHSDVRSEPDGNFAPWESKGLVSR